jgi:hypothetical protein
MDAASPRQPAANLRRAGLAPLPADTADGRQFPPPPDVEKVFTRRSGGHHTVVILSAVVPTLIAQTFFRPAMPFHAEAQAVEERCRDGNRPWSRPPLALHVCTWRASRHRAHQGRVHAPPPSDPSIMDVRDRKGHSASTGKADTRCPRLLSDSS